MYWQHLGYNPSISSSVLIPPLSFPGFHSQGMIGSSSQGSGSSNRSRSHGTWARTTNRIRAGKLPQWCGCGMRPVLRWSGTDANPKRPFFGCPNYNTAGKKWCGLFVWADEEDETIVGRVDSARDVDHWKMNLRWTIRDLEVDVRNLKIWNCVLSLLVFFIVVLCIGYGLVVRK